MTTLPQLGSAPCTAHLTSGELTTALATRLAWPPSLAEPTVTWMTLVAPSPSAASCKVSERHTASKRLLEARPAGPARRPRWPEQQAVSEVEVSVSMESELKVASTTGGTPRPAPLGYGGVGEHVGEQSRHIGLDHARPLGDARDHGAWPARALASLGTVSVVMMARATEARSAVAAPPRPFASRPRWARMRSIGYGRPMTPVEPTRTSAGRHPTARGHQLGELVGVPVALAAGGDVGVLGHGDDGAGGPRLQVVPAQDDAGAGEKRPGEHARGGARQGAGHDGEIHALVLDPDVGGVGHETLGDGHGRAASLVRLSSLPWFDHDRAATAGAALRPSRAGRMDRAGSGEDVTMNVIERVPAASTPSSNATGSCRSCSAS